MKMFDKIKDLFTDEVEVEEEPVKREVIQVEIPAPVKQTNEEKVEVPSRADLRPKTPEEARSRVEERITPKEKSPFFDEDDFDDIQRLDTIKRSNPSLDELYKEAEKRNAVEEVRKPYAPKKEEPVKKFNPTPIISPVYGVLDKNYKKDDIVNKAEVPKVNKDLTVDDVRNKAYGTLEDELESTLFGRTSILFQKETKDKELEELEKDLDDTAAAIDLIKEEAEKTEEEPKHIKKEKSKGSKSNILDEYLDDDNKLADSDLFNLIDDMYGKGDK